MLNINWKQGPVGFLPAVVGMRNPLNSWNKNDTRIMNRYVDIGPSDLKLAKELALAGPTHAKYRRMITVWVDITAPLYWWKEFDTYKVGTVANSCSTMHKIHEKEFTLEDFSCEHLIDSFEYSTDEGEGTVSSDYLDTYCLLDAGEADGFESTYNAGEILPIDILNLSIAMLNRARKLYLKTKDKKYWWQMIQLLPSSYNQKRTVCLNYEVLSHIYTDRRNHKLDEWHTFCDWIEELPHAKEMIFPEKEEMEAKDENTNKS